MKILFKNIINLKIIILFKFYRIINIKSKIKILFIVDNHSNIFI